MCTKIAELIYTARFIAALKVFPCVLPELKKKWLQIFLKYSRSDTHIVIDELTKFVENF